MTIRLRPAQAEDSAALTELCLRSKAHWGYDAAFMDACRDELTLRPEEIGYNPIVVLDADGVPLATAQVTINGADAELHKFFVDPSAMGRGYGRRLFDWALHTARNAGAQRIRIEADPQAAPFYEKMGAQHVGQAPSGSIPDRVLPVFQVDLKERADAAQ